MATPDPALHAAEPAPAGADPPPGSSPVSEALEFTEARLGAAVGGSGEPIAAHARGTLEILEALNVDEPTRVAAVLFGVGEAVPLDEIVARWGDEVGTLVDGMRQLLRLKDLTLRANASSSGVQLETLRRMTLAMASDIRVVLLRLASRLQSLRWHAESRRAPEAGIAHETLEVLAPLANRHAEPPRSPPRFRERHAAAFDALNATAVMDMKRVAQARGELAEVHSRGRQAQRPGRRRQGHVPPHVL